MPSLRRGLNGVTPKSVADSPAPGGTYEPGAGGLRRRGGQAPAARVRLVPCERSDPSANQRQAAPLNTTTWRAGSLCVDGRMASPRGAGARWS